MTAAPGADAIAVASRSHRRIPPATWRAGAATVTVSRPQYAHGTSFPLKLKATTARSIIPFLTAARRPSSSNRVNCLGYRRCLAR
jgi:hypothetical protein